MRQHHVAGEKLFVDYAGHTRGGRSRGTGEVRRARSSSPCSAPPTSPTPRRPGPSSCPTGSAATSGAFEASAAHPNAIVPDNAKSAVGKACCYEPKVNRTYADMAAHYGTAILPARPRKPRDKAKVEAAVQIVERWLLASSPPTFHCLAELNVAISELVTSSTTAPVRALGASRRDLFQQIDQPALRPLPTRPHEFAEWRNRRVGIDYHVEIAAHY